MALWLLAGLAWAEAPTPLVSWTFEEDDGDLQSTGTTGQWAWGPVESGPRAGYTGGYAWATGLEGLYLNDAEDYLQLPSYALNDAVRPIVQFRHWYAIDDTGDLARLEVWTGASWQVIEPVYDYPQEGGYAGISNGWERAWVDLTGLADASHLRFAFLSDQRIALEGWYLDDVMIFDGDPVPPLIERVTDPSDTQDLEGPYIVEALVRDDSSEVTVELRYVVAGVASTVPMTLVSDGTWIGLIPGQSPDTVVEWSVSASDGNNDARSPEDTDESFRVFLAAPTNVAGPGGRIVDVEAELTWDAPDSPHPVQSYIVYRDGELVETSTTTAATVPLSGPLDTFEVSAVYSAGEGDLSDPVSLRVHVPSVEALDPAEAWQGDLVRVAVTGQDLLFTAADAGLELGAGVTVLETDVVDASRAIFTLALDDDAATGLRDATVVSGDVRLDLSAAFSVLDGADQPALTSIAPETIHRGDEIELRIRTNTDLFEAPEVDLGDGLIVQDVRLEGGVVCVSAAVEHDAALGTRHPVVDDGVRLLDGVELRVTYDAGAPDTGCSTSRGGLAGSLAGLIALLALARRKR